MNQQKIMELIHASQTTIKVELMQKHPESKYNLLMLLRSLSIIEKHVRLSAEQQQQQLTILADYFKFPVSDAQQGLEQLSKEMRHQQQMPLPEVLKQLNQLDLNLT